jgi:hypothetical protein
MGVFRIISKRQAGHSDDIQAGVCILFLHKQAAKDRIRWEASLGYLCDGID